MRRQQAEQDRDHYRPDYNGRANRPDQPARRLVQMQRRMHAGRTKARI